MSGRKDETEVEDIGASYLSEDQMILVSQAAEAAARKVIFRHIPRRAILDLNIMVEAVREGLVTFNIDINIVLSPFYKGADLDGVIREAVNEAYEAIRKRVRELRKHDRCKVKRFHSKEKS